MSRQEPRRGPPGSSRFNPDAGYQSYSGGRSTQSRSGQMANGEPSRVSGGNDPDSFISGSQVVNGVRRGPLGRSYATTEDGREFTRRNNNSDWQLRDVGTADSSRLQVPSSMDLFITVQRQGEGDPDHWALVVARENESGDIFQVKGDHQCMTYNPSSGKNIFRSRSFKTAYIMATQITPEQRAVIKRCCETTPPPRADNPREIRVTCQGWTVQVLRKLQAQGIVTAAKVNEADSLRYKLPWELEQQRPPQRPGQSSRPQDEDSGCCHCCLVM